MAKKGKGPGRLPGDGRTGELQAENERLRARLAGYENGDQARLYRLLAESATDVLWTVTTDLRLTYISPSVTGLLGYTPEEAMAMPFGELFPPETLEQIVRLQAEDLAAESRRESIAHGRLADFQLRTRDGSSVWVEVVFSPVRDPEGRLTSFQGACREVTERRRAQQELAASEERFRTIFERSPIGVIIYDADGVPCEVNRACIDMFGSTRDGIVTGPPLFGYPGFGDNVKARLDAGETMTAELPVDLDAAREKGVFWTDRPGKLRIRLIAVATGAVVDGSPRGYLGLVEDVTERRNMEEALREAHAELECRVEQRTADLRESNRQLVEGVRRLQEAQERLQDSESRYRGLVESANSIILELDTRGRVTFFNRFAQEFYGFDQAEILGRPVLGTIAPAVDSAGQDTRAVVRDLVRHPEQWPSAEGEGMRRNGERVWISWTNKGLYDAAGRLRNVLCIGMDRTEQRRTGDLLAEQLREKAAADERQRLARELHDAVTQMLFSAGIIAGVLPRLWDKDQEEARRRLEELRQLTRGALAEMRLLLLELRPAAMAEVGLADLLRHLAEATSGRAGFPVSFSMEGQCALPPEVQMALYRVAQEALANAVKHSRATEARVRLICGRRSASLVVSDNGCGFNLRKVSPENLGLRIMQERVEAAGAGLTVASSKRRGTEVRVEWAGRGGRERR